MILPRNVHKRRTPDKKKGNKYRPETRRESGPNTWFCEWEQCVEIVSKDWEDSEKNSKYLNINPHDPDMWSYTMHPLTKQP